MKLKKTINSILLFIIPKRIGYTVWFAPFAIAIGICAYYQGYNDISIGALLGGFGLILFYILKRRIVKKTDD